MTLEIKSNGGGLDDELIMTPRTCVASASTVPNAGAVPVFADVDRESGNITVETIAAVLSENTKAIIAVHLAGWPCDMDPIMELAEARGIKVIEDCGRPMAPFIKVSLSVLSVMSQPGRFAKTRS